MYLTRRFRAFALIFAIWQAASLPVAAWVDATIQQSATEAQAQFGRVHTEEQGTHHAWAHHGHDCAVCTVIANSPDAPTAGSPVTATSAQFFSTHQVLAGPHYGAQRRQAQPRAPPELVQA